MRARRRGGHCPGAAILRGAAGRQATALARSVGTLAGSDGTLARAAQDLADSYFPAAYAVGARVHSDSWGSASLEYDFMAAQVDLFTWHNQARRGARRAQPSRDRQRRAGVLGCGSWRRRLLPADRCAGASTCRFAAGWPARPSARTCVRPSQQGGCYKFATMRGTKASVSGQQEVHCRRSLLRARQDFVSVFSAGNEGLAAAPANRLSHGMATVTSPATSKNCIAAGATNAARQPAGAAGAGAAYAVFLMSVSQPVDGGLQVVESYRVRL